MNDDAKRKRLAQLRQAFESGLLDEDTYQAAVAALEATVLLLLAACAIPGSLCYNENKPLLRRCARWYSSP